MAAVGWSANPYLALIDPSMRYGGPSPEMMYPQEQAPQQTGAATTGGFDTLASSPYVPTEGGESLRGLGPDVSGKMTPDQRSTVETMANPFGAALSQFGLNQSYASPIGKTMGNVARAGVGFAAPAMNPALGYMSSILGAALLGDKITPQGYQVMTTPSVTDFQSLADRYGYGMPSPMGTAPSGIGGGGWGMTQDPGLNQSTMGLNEAMGIVSGESYGGGPDAGSGPGGQGQDTGSSNTGGAPGGDAPGNWARGGASKAKGFSKLARYGEKGPEEAIFIPQRGAKFDMTRPGIQGNERQVKKALSSNLKKLRG